MCAAGSSRETLQTVALDSGGTLRKEASILEVTEGEWLDGATTGMPLEVQFHHVAWPASAGDQFTWRLYGATRLVAPPSGTRGWDRLVSMLFRCDGHATQMLSKTLHTACMS